MYFVLSISLYSSFPYLEGIRIQNTPWMTARSSPVKAVYGVSLFVELNDLSAGWICICRAAWSGVLYWKSINRKPIVKHIFVDNNFLDKKTHTKKINIILVLPCKTILPLTR